MKKAIILFIFILTGTVAFSQPVSETELRTAALNFYKSVTRNKPEKKNAKIKKLIINKLDGVKTYAVAVFDNNDWVALSTDKSLKPILANSLEGSWTEPIIPPARLWFDLYDHYIYDAKVKNFHSPKDIAKNYPLVWNNLLSNNINNTKDAIVIVPPLLTSKWGVGGANSGGDPYAYNYYMPETDDIDINGNPVHCAHASVCCVALATGQILHYWKHPQCSVFDWDNMPDTLSTSDPDYDIHKKQIANLLINVSVVLPVTHYGCGVSLSYSFFAYRALKDTFGFKDAIYLLRDNNPAYWDSMLCVNLNNHLPVLYSGTRDGHHGHEFICDGWEIINNTDSLFHFVYGRYGDQDGYYSLDEAALVYRFTQDAVMNLTPVADTCDHDSLAIFQYYRNTDTTLYFSPKARIIYSSPEPITIASDETVNYTATDEIVLENFETETGANFTAKLGGLPCISCSVFFDSTATDLNNKRLNNFSVTENTEIKIYPNPSDGIYTVSLSNYYENSEVCIYDCFGGLIMKMKPVSNKFQIDLSDKPSGIYLIKIITKENIYQQKIIKL